MPDNAILSPIILSPVMLWENFNPAEPLNESNVGEDVYGNVVYREMYFSGRNTSDVSNAAGNSQSKDEFSNSDRVRIYGVYARSRTTGKRSNKGAILILPDMCDTVNYEVINIYVEQGYSVLMLDYRGEWDGVDNYTKYPQAVAYANYKNVMNNVDDVDMSAKRTCWYEWAAVAKYGITFLKSREGVVNVGVLGIKNGANVGWMVCGTEKRVSCFVPLFGSGWRAYRGIFKNGDEELTTNDNKLRYLAGVDAQVYSQYVNCPVFYLTATNCPDFDFDRSSETLARVPKDVENYIYYSPTFRDVLDDNSKRDIDLFFAKYLIDFKLAFPDEPALTCTINGDKINFDLKLDYSELKRPKHITVYVAEGGVNPANRDWQTATPLKGLREDNKQFAYTISGNCDFITAFAVVEYRNGITLSSKSVSRKVSADGELRQKKLLYCTKDKTGSFTAYSLKDKSLGGLFFKEGLAVEYSLGANAISGVSSGYGLVTYCLNNRNTPINSRSIIMFDLYTAKFTQLDIVIMVESAPLETIDYVAHLELKGGAIWQKINVNVCDFKNTARLSVKDYDKVVGIRFESDNKCVFNNILVI